MAETSTETQSIVGIGREAADAVKRLVRLEVQLVKEQLKASVIRFGVGAGLALVSLVSLQLYLVFLLGTVAEARDFDDNHIAMISGGALLAGMLCAALASLGWRAVFFTAGAVMAVASLLASLWFLVAAVFFTDHIDARRAWAITALALFGMTVVLLASGAALIMRAIAGGKNTAHAVKGDVSWAVDDVRTRRWRD
jgi:hypothetical protein